MKLQKITILALLACMMAGCEQKGLSFGKKADYSSEREEYTVMLSIYNGATGVRLASASKSELEAMGWKDVFVVHEEGTSTLYMGHFDSIDSASDDLKKAKNYVLPNGRRPFEKALVMAIPGSKDEGPEKWNFKNAVGRYSVMVAIFYDVPQQDYFGRKQRAVELCTELRKRGEEAYFYHDPSKSGVMIGTFGPNAIKTETVNVEHPVTHTTFQQERKIVVDPKMKRVLADYPELLVCGNTEITKKIEFKNGKPTEVREISPSYPVGVPNWEEKIGKQKSTGDSQGKRRVRHDDYIGYP